MAENSNIEWTHHTFNPWIGCTKVSPACDNCYAEDWDKRYNGGEHWGAKAPRRRTKTWHKPVKWNKEAIRNDTRYRVFCASLADVFDNKVPTEWRDDLWTLIRETPHLDWLLLTKRPQNIEKMLPDDWGDGYANVWLGTTVENQEEANRRIPPLLEIPARVRFLSCEPLLGEVNLTAIDYGDGFYVNCLTEQDDEVIRQPRIDWVITGGESGNHFRSADPFWFRTLRDQCLSMGVPFLFKQWEGVTQLGIKAKGRELDGIVWDQYPEAA